MNVFLKYIFKSTLCKKGRSLLLIITIAISAALLIGTLGAVTASSTASKEQSKSFFGDYNVVIHAKNTTETPFFNKDKISNDEFDTYVASISTNGYLNKDDNINILVQGVALGDYSKLPNMRILQGEQLNPLDGDRIIISEKISNIYNYKLGDTIELNLKEKNKIFKVAAIAETKGVFSTDTKNQFTVVTDEKNIWNVLGTKEISDTVCAKLKNNVDSSKFVKNYNEKNDDSIATLAFDKDKADADAESVISFLYFMLILVVFMSSFIVYSCFKLIVIERSPIIGTFLSQGETIAGIIKLLLGESLIYGIISGILSVFFGWGLLYLLADILNNYKQYGVATKVECNLSYFAAGFIFAIVISLIASLIPVLAISRVQVKDIILNKTSALYKKSYRLPILGITLALIAIIINSINSSITINLSPIMFVLFLIGAIISLPSITKILSYYLIQLFQNFNILFKLAFNNIRTSKVLLNNIRLIVIGMVSIMIIMSLSTSYTNALLGVVSDLKYDITVKQGADPAKIKSIIYKNSSVKKVIETYFVGDGKIKGTNGEIPIGGIDPETYKDFNNYFGISNKEEFYKELDKKERNVAISNITAKTLGKSKGDSIVLNINNKEAEYKIIGIFDVKLEENQILINKDNMINDFGVTVPDEYALQINGNADGIKKTLEKELKGTSAKITTFDEDVKNNKDDNRILINILLFFSLMTVIIGTFGIINNIGVSFIQRKKELAILNCVGMTNMRNGMMILIESIFTAIFATGFGFVISWGAVAMSNNLLKSIDVAITMEYDFKAFFMVSIGIFIIMILSSCSVIIKNSKLSVLQELKYE